MVLTNGFGRSTKRFFVFGVLTTPMNPDIAKSPNRDLLRVLLVHPGTQHAPRLATELERRGLLWRFWTGIGVVRGKCSRPRRRMIDIPIEKLRTISWVEILALGLARLPIKRERLWHWRNWLFQKLIPQSEIGAVDVVIGFDTASWVIGERAKKVGKKFVLDQSVGHPLSRANAVMEAGGNKSVWPEAFVPRLEIVTWAERREHELADAIIVASSFSRRTLLENGVSEEKIRLLPYGVADEFLEIGSQRFKRGCASRHAQMGRKRKSVRFLYAGHLGRRKGVGFLLEAWDKMEHEEAELCLIGGGRWEGRVPKGVRLLGQTSRRDLLQEMAEADVFVFPSLFEGFGLVILEAMAAGLAVITTANTAGPDLMEDGKEGMIIAPGNVESLQQAMESLMSDFERIKKLGEAAHEKAQMFSWKRWGRAYAEVLFDL